MVVNISKQVNCERFETRSATAKGLITTEGFCKVTFEYCMKWKRHKSSTYTRKQNNFRNTDGRSNWQTKDNSVPVKGSTRDLLDIIDDEEAAMAVVDTGDCGEELLQVADQESTEPSDLQCPSEHSFDNDSPMYGPSFPHMTQGLCSGCHNLYQTAKKKKRPLKNKPYNDPTSLSCDQWVTQKRRSTRRPHGMKSTVWEWDHHVMVRLSKSFCKKRNKGEWDQPTCSRPHTFLKRNLKKCMVGIKRGTAEKSRRKRLKDVAQDGSLSKQPRLDDTGDCGEELLQVADQESTEPSELQCPSERSFDNDSTMSGPSFPNMMQEGLCSGCHKLYQTAKKKKKRPLKNKLLDPTSLSCDQWVMQKWRSTRRPHGMKSTVWDHHVMVRISESFCKKQNKGEWDQPTCSRPHTFLKRNLKKCMVGIKRGRTAQDGSLTKLPRVDDSGISSLHSLDLSNISSYSSPVCSEVAGSNDQCSEVISTSVNVNGTGQLKMSPPKQSAAKKRACFNELFAQLFHKKCCARI